jgi:mRNA interferase MazF
LVTPYVPDTGHIIWLSPDPQQGREQSGRRPFLVLSPRSYNAKTSLSLGVPIASKQKGYPFEVPLSVGNKISGVALADQITSVDWRARLADFAEEASPATIRAVRNLVATLLAL